jgi:hypothetical protein
MHVKTREHIENLLVSEEPSMKSINTLLLVFLFALACSSSRDDPVNPGDGGISPGAGRANLAVDQSNHREAYQAFFELVLANYFKAVDVVSSANDPDNNQVRILGNYDGYAIASRIAPDSSGAGDPYSLDLELDYNGYYSETGQLFIKGKLELYGVRVGTSAILNQFDLNGTVEFSGDYACSVKFEGFRMALDSNGQAIDLPYTYAKYLVCGATFALPGYGFVTTTSEGAPTLRFNPYDFDRIILEEMPHSTREDSIFYGCYP